MSATSDCDKLGVLPFRRRMAMKLIGLGLMMPLMARAEGKKQREVVLDVEMYSYVDRVVTNIIFNGTDLGVMNRYGGTGTVTGVRIPFGVQTLAWTLGGPEARRATANTCN